MDTSEQPDRDRTQARAGDLLPEEQGSADPEAQAEAILAESDEREQRTGEVEHRSSEQAAGGEPAA